MVIVRDRQDRHPIDVLNELVDQVPYDISEDINRRIGDWLAAGGSRDDPYIWQQVRAAENAIAAIKREEGEK